MDFFTQTSRVAYTNTANLPTFHWWHRAAMSTQQADREPICSICGASLL